MKPVVIDASALLAWLLGDNPPTAALFDAVLQRATTAPLLAPTLMRTEVANALAVATRRGRLTPAQARQAARYADSLPIELEPQAETIEDLFTEAASQGLTAYDALYLRVAIRRTASMLIADDALAAAARTAGVELIAA